MIAYLTGRRNEPLLEEKDHPIDSWRLGIIAFINDYWSTLEPQLKCPAKDLRSHNPRPCFGCVDAQVIACVTKNDSKVEQLIQIHRNRQ